MKKILSLILSLLLVAAPMAIVSADGLSVEVDSVGYTVTVTVTGAVDRATLKVIPYESDYSSSLDYTKPVYIGEKALSEGTCTFKFNFLDIPDPTGYYCAVVNNEITEGGKFRFITPTAKFNFYKALATASVTEIKGVIYDNESTAIDFDLGKYKTKYVELGELIDEQIAELNGAYSEALGNSYTGAFNTAVTQDSKDACVAAYEPAFKAEFNALLALADFVTEENAADFDAYILANSGVTGLGFTTTYYTEDLKEGVFENKFIPDSFKDATETPEITVKDMFNIALLLSATDTAIPGVVTNLLAQCESEGSLDLYEDPSNPLTGEEITELSIDLQGVENLDHTNILQTYEDLYKAIIEGRTDPDEDDDDDGFAPAPNPTPLDGDKEPDEENPGEDVTPGELSDINDAPWAEEAITALVEKGVLSGRGDGKFYPNDTVTREEFVKIVVEAFDVSKDHDGADFADVANNRWSYDYVAAAVKAGIVSGDSESTFNPTGKISRQDMAVIIYRTAKALGLELSDDDGADFADITDVADYAKDAVKALYAAGIINGTGENKFSPNDVVTRAQAAKIVYEALMAMGGTK